MKLFIPIALASALTLSACGTNPHTGEGTFTNANAGTVIGAVVGAYAGGQFSDGKGKTVAAVLGGLLGAWAGNQFGTYLSEKDKPYYTEAATQASTAPVGQTVTWYSPETGANGSITPTRTGTTQDGRYCREYQQTVTVGGKTESAYGQACQQPDGSWEIVK